MERSDLVCSPRGLAGWHVQLRLLSHPGLLCGHEQPRGADLERHLLVGAHARRTSPGRTDRWGIPGLVHLCLVLRFGQHCWSGRPVERNDLGPDSGRRHRHSRTARADDLVCHDLLLRGGRGLRSDLDLPRVGVESAARPRSLAAPFGVLPDGPVLHGPRPSWPSRLVRRDLVGLRRGSPWFIRTDLCRVVSDGIDVRRCSIRRLGLLVEQGDMDDRHLRAP